MALTSTNATLTKAENRRRWHRKQVDNASHVRERVWKAAGWFLAELLRRPHVEQEDAIERLLEMATELNERSGGDDYT